MLLGMLNVTFIGEVGAQCDTSLCEADEAINRFQLLSPNTFWPKARMVTITELFAAIKASQSELVRKLILQDKSLLTQKLKTEEAKFDVAVELDAHRFIGAYLGSLSPLHYAILVGEEQIAKDIIETTFKEDLDDTFGVIAN